MASSLPCHGSKTPGTVKHREGTVIASLTLLIGRYRMQRLALIAVAFVVPATAWAQGVNDPSTPNRNVIIVNPSQSSPTTATPNIPSQIQPPITRGGRAQPYVGNRTRTSGSARR